MKVLYRKEMEKGTFWVTTDELSLKTFHPKQVHGNRVVNINELPTNADGIWWKWDEIGTKLVAVYTADCLPIAIEGELGGALLHAGWRGIHKRIHLTDEIKNLKPNIAVIGPSIQQKNFEVTKEFYDNFPDSKNFSEQDGKITFNLQQQAKDELLQDFPTIKIIDQGLCTFQNNQYNSYRRDGSTNRNYNIYQLKDES